MNAERIKESLEDANLAKCVSAAEEVIRIFSRDSDQKDALSEAVDLINQRIEYWSKRNSVNSIWFSFPKPSAIYHHANTADNHDHRTPIRRGLVHKNCSSTGQIDTPYPRQGEYHNLISFQLGTGTDVVYGYEEYDQNHFLAVVAEATYKPILGSRQALEL